PPDSTLAAHCRQNGNSALPLKGAASDKNTSLLVVEEVTRPIEQFGHIVARPRSPCCRTSLMQRMVNRASRMLPATAGPSCYYRRGAECEVDKIGLRLCNAK